MTTRSLPPLGRLFAFGWLGVLLVATPACGGAATLEPSGSGGAGPPGGSGAGGEAGAGGQHVDCPPEAPQASTPCELGEAIVCTYPVDCQSGQRSLGFRCAGSGLWDMAPGQTCEYPYDSCPNTTYYCDGEWLIPGPEAPTPCPSVAPAAAQTCFPGVPGASWELCGYSCDADASAGWTIATCVELFDPNNPGAWQYDGACGVDDGP